MGLAWAEGAEDAPKVDIKAGAEGEGGTSSCAAVRSCCPPSPSYKPTCEDWAMLGVAGCSCPCCSCTWAGLGWLRDSRAGSIAADLEHATGRSGRRAPIAAAGGGGDAEEGVNAVGGVEEVNLLPADSALPGWPGASAMGGSRDRPCEACDRRCGLLPRLGPVPQCCCSVVASMAARECACEWVGEGQGWEQQPATCSFACSPKASAFLLHPLKLLHVVIN